MSNSDLRGTDNTSAGPMELELWRFSGAENDTLGILFDVSHPGRPHFLCFTLEDEHRRVKVAGETRIPAGRYALSLRTEGGMHPKYASKYPFHRGMLWLRAVPNFQWVYIHTGNDEDHTEGCLLVGNTCTQNAVGPGRVGDSRAAYSRIYPPIADAILAGRSVHIRIRDERALNSQRDDD